MDVSTLCYPHYDLPYHETRHLLQLIADVVNFHTGTEITSSMTTENLRAYALKDQRPRDDTCVTVKTLN